MVARLQLLETLRRTGQEKLNYVEVEDRIADTLALETFCLNLT